MSNEPCHCEPAEPDPQLLPRRRFFTALLGVAVTVVGTLQAVPVLRTVLYPLFANTSGFGWSDLGALSEFENITAPVRRTVQVLRVDGWRQAQFEEAVYVVRQPSGAVQVLSSVCPHLGCAVTWQAPQDRFFCPCHSSVFSPDGAVTRGPALRSLDPLESSVANGRLRVRFALFQPLLSHRVPMS